MSAQSRLFTAVADGLLTIPDGPVSLLRPPVTFDVGPLGAHPLTICHSFYPDQAAWTDAGFETVQKMQPAQTTVVSVPRAKALARDMVAQAAATSDLIIIDGQKTDGVDSLFKACRKRLGDLPSLTKAHGRIFWFNKTDAFADWAALPPAKGANGFYTTAGVFSDGEIDKGSALLAAALPPKLPKRVADLGAGWGYLADAILRRDGVASLDLIEAEALSLDCARLNVTDPRASFHWADATTFTPEKAYDAIVMNPPFHAGRASDPGLGRAFIAAAARMLAPNGQLWMVANRHLPYEGALRDHFRQVDELSGNGAFKIFNTARPTR